MSHRKVTTAGITKEHEYDLRIMISVAEACWRPREPSYSWHVLDWICYRQRLKYPLIWPGGVVNTSAIIP